MTHETTHTPLRRPSPPSELLSPLELERSAKMSARRADPRVGAIVYQAYVDRFAPSARVDKKRGHYSAPRSLRGWDEVPRKGKHIPGTHLSDTQLDFWGGDLASLRARLDHLESLGVQWLYLNPIFEAYSNHKYDASTFDRVDPQYGTNAELAELADDLHARGMRLMLDGVFNHMGENSPMFQRALADPNSPEGAFFHVGEQFRNGWRGWRDGGNLPELNLENPQVRDWIYGGPNSIVRRWLRDCGVDGWRLDVAPDLGLRILAEITRASHEARPGSWVVAECWNYPQDWLTSVDGIMLMHVRELMLALAGARVSPTAFSRAIERILSDCDYEAILRSHVVLDNHDTPRTTHLVPDEAMRFLLWTLQFTLPGGPVIYYGSELGMEGGHDPLNRAPMRWDLLTDGNRELAFVRKLVHARRANPALIIGDCRVLDAERLVAYLRMTEHAVETIMVVANPSAHETVTETFPVRQSLWMDASPIECILSGDQITLHSGLATVTLPPKSVRLFRTVDRGHHHNYSMFKRVL